MHIVSVQRTRTNIYMLCCLEESVFARSCSVLCERTILRRQCVASRGYVIYSLNASHTIHATAWNGCTHKMCWIHTKGERTKRWQTENEIGVRFSSAYVPLFFHCCRRHRWCWCFCPDNRDEINETCVCVHSIIIKHAHDIYICSDCSTLIVQADSGRERERLCVSIRTYKVFDRPNDAMPTLDD